jgi:hypothetical protein
MTWGGLGRGIGLGCEGFEGRQFAGKRFEGRQEGKSAGLEETRQVCARRGETLLTGELFGGAGSGKAYHPVLPLQHLTALGRPSRVTYLYGRQNMIPTSKTCIERIESCITDLSENGINLVGADDRKLAHVVREHLEYFQLMLGYDSDPKEVLNLLKRNSHHPA